MGSLAAALFGLGAGLVSALMVWIVLLVLTAQQRTSPGCRAVGLRATGALSAAGRLLDVRTGREVQIGAVAVATVLPRHGGCATLVVVGGGAPTVRGEDDSTCR